MEDISLQVEQEKLKLGQRPCMPDDRVVQVESDKSGMKGGSGGAGLRVRPGWWWRHGAASGKSGTQGDR